MILQYFFDPMKYTLILTVRTLGSTVQLAPVRKSARAKFTLDADLFAPLLGCLLVKLGLLSSVQCVLLVELEHLHLLLDGIHGCLLLGRASVQAKNKSNCRERIGASEPHCSPSWSASSPKL